MNFISRRPRASWPGPGGRVYLVMRDDTPDNNVLGVFASQADADSFSDEIFDRFPEGSIILLTFDEGWRYDGGAARYYRAAPEI